MPLPLLTARLRLRGPRLEDFEALLAGIWSSPTVMRFVGEPRSRVVAAERFAWSCELDHHGSQRVLAKLGFRATGTIDCYGRPQASFETGPARAAASDER